MNESHSAQLNRQGNELFSRGFYTEAYQCYSKALEADRLSGDQRALTATLGNLGNICAVSGRRANAQVYYREVLELQKILGDERGISITLANLGNLCVDAGEWEQGRAYYLEALDLMDQSLEEWGKAVLLSDLGLVEKESGNPAQALRYYEQAILLMRRVENVAGQADVYRMMARLLLGEKQYEEALACGQTSLAIADRLNDELRMGGAWYVMAGCYEAQGNLEKTGALLEKVIQIDRKFQLPKLEENTRRLHRIHQQLDR